MVWSDDLAKLKQSLKADEGGSARDPRPPAKARPQPAQAPKTLEEEDEMFLAAMGKAAAARPRADDPQGGDGFGDAMRGVKPLGAASGNAPAAPHRAAAGQGRQEQPTKADAVPPDRQPPPTKADAAPPGSQDPRGTQPPPGKADAAAPTAKRTDAAEAGRQSHRDATLALLGHLDAEDGNGPWAAAGDGQAAAHGTGAAAHGPPHLPPERIQLAAGMTIDVDSVLDLRKHNEADAGERLKERVLDGACLGWRAMHVILGNAEPLRQVLLDYVASPQAHPLSKYGEAPVPMGGQQAWILYFGQVPTQDLDHEAMRQ